MVHANTVKAQAAPILEKCGCADLHEWASKFPGEHLDIKHNGLTFCALCGFVLPRTGHSKPCRGVVEIELR